MAQLHLILSQSKEEKRQETFRQYLEGCLNGILKVESVELVHALPYQRSKKRSGSRNGFRNRKLKSRLGTLFLRLPKHRDCQPLRTMIFSTYSRNESAVISMLAEMLVNGVSSRKVKLIMEMLCGTSYSKFAVSEARKELSFQVKAFRERPIEGRHPFDTVDATYSGAPRPEHLHIILGYIDEHLFEPELTRQMIARRFSLKVLTLYRLFKEYLQVSPTTYIVQQRLEHAKKMLTISTLSIKSIAAQTGFSNASYLTHLFHQHFGITPKKYRHPR